MCIRDSPPTAHCYTGPDDPENFVHVWTIADFRNKMEKYKLGEVITSDEFLIGDTKWYLELYPAGYEDDEYDDEGSPWVGVYLHQESQKTVEATFWFFTGKTKTGDGGFNVWEEFSKIKWAEGFVDGEDEATCCGTAFFVSHETIGNLDMLSPNGSFELITKIKVKGAIARTGDEIITEELTKRERMKVGGDIEKIMASGEATDFEVWCDGEVINCHKTILSARYQQYPEILK